MVRDRQQNGYDLILFVCLFFGPLEAFTAKYYINKKEGGLYFKEPSLPFPQVHPKKKERSEREKERMRKEEKKERKRGQNEERKNKCKLPQTHEKHKLETKGIRKS